MLQIALKGHQHTCLGKCGSLSHVRGSITESIEKNLEKPNLKVEVKKSKNAKVLLREHLYGNEQKLSASKGFQHKLFKKYQSVMETFRLVKGSK